MIRKCLFSTHVSFQVNQRFEIVIRKPLTRWCNHKSRKWEQSFYRGWRTNACVVIQKFFLHGINASNVVRLLLKKKKIIIRSLIWKNVSRNGWQKFLVNMFMDPENMKKENKECETLSGDKGLKDILQLLKEQSEKMERLGLALKVIQDGMRQNTPTTVKTSVWEAAQNHQNAGSTSEVESTPRTSWCRLPGRGGLMYCLLLNRTNGPKTLLGIRIH